MHPALHLVVGLGKTGHSIARYLLRSNLPFVAYDTRKNPPDKDAFQQEFPGVDLYCGEFPTELYAEITDMICSPGVSLDEPFILRAMEKRIPVYGDIECLARAITAPLIAITGTNGKSTVTTLVGEMAKAAGLKVAVGGNIGLPVLDILGVGVDYDLWVLELSSFQLDLCHSLKPTAATVLNVTPDHLDRHHSFQAYLASKQRIYQQTENLVYNRDDPYTRPEFHLAAEVGQHSFGSDAPTGEDWGLRQQQGEIYLARGEQLFFPVSALKIKGKHNWMNALAACALAESAGIEQGIMQAVLTRFSGLAHRAQWVRHLDGVDWINDSKGTNVGATVSAIAGIAESISGKIVLIAGGQGKGADFSDLQASAKAHLRGLVLIGEDADKIEQALIGMVPMVHATSLNAAVRQAKLQAEPGDVVLLSPACASFDMFRDFNQRGDDFMTAVLAL